jgi:hypothetical protein
MNKNVKKIIKPAYIVDAINCESPFDLLVAFGEAKQNAGLPITKDELEAIIEANKEVIYIIDTVEVRCERKKLPWYKRFWRWLTKKD